MSIVLTWTYKYQDARDYQIMYDRVLLRELEKDVKEFNNQKREVVL